MRKKTKITITILTILALLIISLGIYWILFLQRAHSTFENYYSFRGCAELIEKTPDYGTCKISSGEIIKIVKYQNKWFLDGDLPFGAVLPTNQNGDINATSSQTEYSNTTYGFTFTLPPRWKGYQIINSRWEGNLLDGSSSIKFNGPIISIRHPLWTTLNPRQDIPIMIFTSAEWNLIQQEKLSVSAAPIPPTLLGQNSQYIFALPARYNYAFPIGFEEVQTIIDSKPLHPKL